MAEATIEDNPYQYHCAFVCNGHFRAVNCLQFSPDGEILASGADDGYIMIWEVSTGKRLQRISPRQGQIVSIRWMEDPRRSRASYIVSGGADGTLKLWKRSDKQSTFDFCSSIPVLDTPVKDIATADTQLAIVGRGRSCLLSVTVDDANEKFRLLAYDGRESFGNHNSMNNQTSSSASDVRPTVVEPNGGGWSLKKTLGWQDDFYKEIQDNVHLIAQKHLDKKNAFVKQDRSNVTLFRQEVQSIYPVLSEYPSSWPIDAFAEMYLKNTSAEHRKHLKARNPR
ncbi:WD40-repeat-containing domain protein [Cyathus striatus]|nr:WD40-repeat-containing domain protein [Cyathus striatus]